MAKQYDKQGKRILDIGTANSPYKKYFKKIDYFTYDIEQNENGNIDYVGDINDGLKAVPDSNFDFILCTQVLEHIKNPSWAFREFYRILKPDGKIFLTTNFIYQIHMAPNDFYRFTKFGLQYLGESNGFAVEHLKPQGGIFHTLSYIITVLPIRLFLKKSKALYHLYLILFSIPIVFLNLMSYFLDVFDVDKEITINYEAIYRRI